MQKIGFAEALDSIVATDNRYSREAYVFLLNALDYTTKQQKKTKSAAPMPTVTLGRVELVDAAMEFFDATVRKPPLRIRLEQLHATVDDVLLPELKGRTINRVRGFLKSHLPMRAAAQ